MAQKKSSTKDKDIATVESYVAIRNKHKQVSSTPTPVYYIEERQNFEYVDEAFMRSVLNNSFPIWNWEILSWEIVEGSIAVHGRLTVNDCGTVRSYDALASHRIAFKRDTNVHVDLGNDLKSANTDCFKVAVNRLCNVSDDVYRKCVLSGSQLDTIEGLIEQLDDVNVQRKVVEGIKAKSINPTNYESYVERLQEKIKGENTNE